MFGTTIRNEFLCYGKYPVKFYIHSVGFVDMEVMKFSVYFCSIREIINILHG